MRGWKFAARVALWAAVAAVGPSCHADEPPIEFETIEQDCDHKCTVAIDECADYPTASLHEDCVEECLDHMERSQEKGRACAQSYETMMVCMATLETCEELAVWARRERDGVCAEVTTVFYKKCEGFT